MSLTYCSQVPGKHRGGGLQADESWAASGIDASNKISIPEFIVRFNHLFVVFKLSLPASPGELLIVISVKGLLLSTVFCTLESRGIVE